MRILTTPCQASELEPGDLFSFSGPDYWREVPRAGAIAEKILVCTAPIVEARDANVPIYRVQIDRHGVPDLLPAKRISAHRNSKRQMLPGDAAMLKRMEEREP